MAGPTNQVILPNDYAIQQQQAQRKQQMLEAMVAPLLKGQQGHMAGQVYVGGDNAGSALGKILGTYLLSKSQKEGDAAQLQAASNYKTTRDAEITKYLQNAKEPSRESAIAALTSSYPELQALGQTDLAQYNKENTPFTRMFKGMMGAGQQPAGAPGAGGAPAANPQTAQIEQVRKQLFPNLTLEEVMLGLHADPEGKELFKLNAKRNDPVQIADNATLGTINNGSFTQTPGSGPAQAANAGNVAAAKERAKASYDMAPPVETEGGYQYGTRLQQVEQATGGASSFGPRTVGPAVGNQQQLPAQAAPGNMKVPTGVQQQRDNERLAILRAEYAGTQAPLDKQAIQREYARAGGNPGDLTGPTGFGPGSSRAGPAPAAPSAPGFQVPYNSAMRTADTDIRKDDVKTFGEARTQAQKAQQALTVVSEMRKTLKGGTFSGAFGTTQERAAAFGSALGIKVDPSKLSNSQYLVSLAQNLIIPQVKQLGFNPTDADAARIEKMVGGLNSDPKAFDSILSLIEQIGKRDVAKFKAMDSHVRANKSLSGFDYGVEEPAPAAGAPMSLDDYIKSRSK